MIVVSSVVCSLAYFKAIVGGERLSGVIVYDVAISEIAGFKIVGFLETKKSSCGTIYVIVVGIFYLNYRISLMQRDWEIY
jgi:hypothetical protein